MLFRADLQGLARLVSSHLVSRTPCTATVANDIVPTNTLCISFSFQEHNAHSQQTTANQPSNMDEDLILFIFFLVALIGVPTFIVFAILASVAYSRTKAWDKARNQESISLESDSSKLLDDNEDEFYDTEDEEESVKRKAEVEADRYLTFNQKWRKELGKCWSGGNGQVRDAFKKKEREERRKLAKAVVREMQRVERKKARVAAREDDLPAYKKA